MKKLSSSPQLLKKFLKNKVVVIDPETTYVDKGVTIGQKTTILPFTFILGKSKIGSNSEIGPMTQIKDCRIGNQNKISFSVIFDSIIKNKVTIGPYAHIRPDTELDDEVKVGSFTEVKKSKVGRGSKLPHLGYLGDSKLGKGVNFGCGAITANYDGKIKRQTIIEDGVFIGSDSNLIAPLHIKKGAYIAAGSTVASKDPIPAHSLAVCRTRKLYIKKNWAKKRK